MMQKISKMVPWENDLRGWLVILPEDCGELLCRLNLIICESFFTHSSSNVSANAIIIKRNKNGATLSPCLTPTLKDMDMSVSPRMRHTLLSAYIRRIADRSLGGQPYLARISTISLWFEVSKAFTRSANIMNVGKLWLCRK